MNHPKKALVLILRLVGIVELFAIPAVVMPFGWMAAIHSYLGMGELPDAPIVSYLARSTSMLYAVHGAVTLYITFDLERYWPLVRFWAIAIVIMGGTLLVIDVAIGMPTWWTLGEGPFVIAYGCTVWWLWRRAEAHDIR
jgi:hypothetical protein